VVVVADLNQAGAGAGAAQIQADGGTALASGVDVTDSDAVKTALDQVVRGHRRGRTALRRQMLRRKVERASDTRAALVD
jgi:hypothetical protein